MNKREGRLHLKLYITMIFCVVIAIFITSTILYINFQSILLRHEYNAKLEKMESEAARITKLSDIALSTLDQIFNDISVKKLLRYDDINYVDESAAFIQLRYYLFTVPNVDSIYVYNMNNNRIYNVSRESLLVRPWNADYDKNDGNFFDKSAVGMLNNCTDYLPYIPVPRYYPVNDNNNKRVYSYIMYNTFNNSERSDAVMLNFDSGYLFQEDIDDKVSISLVVDQNDIVIYSDSDKFQVAKKLSRELDPEGMIEKDGSGYFLTEIEGTKSVLIYTGTDKHHWRYFTIIDYNVLLSQVNKMQAISIMITLFIAGVGVLIAHIFSIRLSIPIKTMSKNVKNLQNENRQLERIDRNRKAVELLENGGLDSKGKRKTGRDFLSLFDMEFTGETKLIVLSINVDGYKALLETQGALEVQVYKFAVYNILNELIGDKAKIYHLDTGKEKCLIFMNADIMVTNEYLEGQIKQMQCRIKDYFSVSMSVIISESDKDPDTVYSMYEKIQETLSRSIFFEEGYIIFITEMEVKTDYNYEYPEQLEKNLMESLMIGKADEAKKIYEDIIGETYQYPIIIYNMVISRLMFAIDKVVNVIKMNGLQATYSGYLVLSNLIQEDDRIEARNKKFYELFDRIQKEMENRKNEKQEQIIEKINDMIETRFHDSSLSLDYLADSIGMSVAYMCRIYKQYSGNTINDKIAGMRMSKARELLATTQLSISDIAKKVGYSNSTYFYRVFKKENGVTPNEFRRK